MPKNLRYLGLDVHTATIAVAVAESDGTVRELGIIRNRPEAVRKLLAKLGPLDALRVCHETGPTGYPLYWQLTALDLHCDVIVPSLVPTKVGDWVKTDRKDDAKFARCYRAGDLTAVCVPDAATEALRDLVRAREGAKQDPLRARHRVSKFLLRHGRHRPDGIRAWGVTHARWLAQQRFELPTLQVVPDAYRATLGVLADRVARLERAIDAAPTTLAPTQQALVSALTTLRGVQQVTAATLVSEPGTLRRFASVSRTRHRGGRATARRGESARYPAALACHTSGPVDDERRRRLQSSVAAHDRTHCRESRGEPRAGGPSVLLGAVPDVFQSE